MKAAFIAIGLFIGVLTIGLFGRFLGLGFGIIQLPLQKLENKLELTKGVLDKTYSTEYCLANYEWFKDTNNDIIQSDAQIKNKQDQLDQFISFAGDRANWTFEDKQQYNRLSSEVTGLKNYRSDLVGQYNSKTSQLNRVACKELPLFIGLE